ncbi:uncharacterized protein LOC129720748 [Wyeomyia smithii]|uniref:uncharacterized protein LOC129720748 n=1 Tax=Wyeomyia smithii TaxID=174621 RepID=UPI002467E967|nr:uncharacterized protein LOC129720748 [Wyeomyia smithii]
MVWTRPSQPAVPVVWHTFEAKDGDDSEGRVVTYRVQDLTEDRYEDMIEHFMNHFVEEEPMSVSMGTTKDPQMRTGSSHMWRAVLKEQMTLVCYKDGSDEIIGANILAVRDNGNYLDTQLDSKNQSKALNVIHYCSKQFDYTEHYGVKLRLVAYGLAVNKRYRGRGIATEILKARVPMCKALGIQLAAHPFSAIGSQKAATNAGYRTDYEITYDDLAKMGPDYTMPNIQSKSFKLMSFAIE